MEETVSVILPIRNEGKYIHKCLQSLLAQSYPQQKIEIIVVDGMSNDETRDIIKEFCGRHKNIRLLDNPKEIVPTAMNIGIRNAKGNVVIRIDGHAYADNDFISQSVKCLKETGADCVGGPIENISETYIGKAIALAMSCPFGIGNALFRYSKKARYVDTLAFGAYKRNVFKKMGLFDEELIRCQDDEFNYRLRKAGGKIFLSPEIKSYYHIRSSIQKLWKQYFRYGFWKIRVLQKHPRMMTLRQFIPAIFFISILLSFLSSYFSIFFLYLFLLIIGSYLVLNIFFAFKIAKREWWKYSPILSIIFWCLHFSYGLGFFTGLIYFFRKWFKQEKRPPQLVE